MTERTTFRRLPPEITNLYAELVEQLVAFEASRTIGHAEGSFVTKSVKGQTYSYFQYSRPGDRPRQQYLGRTTPELEALAQRFQEGREAIAADRQNIVRLCASIRAGGAGHGDAATARVLAALAD